MFTLGAIGSGQILPNRTEPQWAKPARLGVTSEVPSDFTPRWPPRWPRTWLWG